MCEYKCEYRCEYMCEIFCWCEPYCTRGERAGYEMGTHDAIEDVIMCEKSVNAVDVLAKNMDFGVAYSTRVAGVVWGWGWLGGIGGGYVVCVLRGGEGSVVWALGGRLSSRFGNSPQVSDFEQHCSRASTSGRFIHEPR